LALLLGFTLLLVGQPFLVGFVLGDLLVSELLFSTDLVFLSTLLLLMGGFLSVLLKLSLLFLGFQKFLLTLGLESLLLCTGLLLHPKAFLLLKTLFFCLLFFAPSKLSLILSHFFSVEFLALVFFRNLFASWQKKCSLLL